MSVTVQNLVKEISELIVQKDSKVGDLLELMHPVEGMHDDVDAASDALEKMQGLLGKKIVALIHHVKQCDGSAFDKALLPLNSRTVGRFQSPDHVSFDIADIEDSMQTELKDLKSSLTAVTTREKERIEGLQVKCSIHSLNLVKCPP